MASTFALQPHHFTTALYYIYKNFNSTVLLVIVNADYEFLFIDVGKTGRLSDGGVLEQTKFLNI